MPYCPKCRAEYRPGFTVCKSCDGLPLVETLPEAATLREDEIATAIAVGYTEPDAGRLIEIDGAKVDPTCVFVFDKAIEVRETLDAEGLASALVPLDLDFPDNVARFEVRVRPSDRDRAHAVLLAAWREQLAQEGVGAGAADDVEKCPACGAHVPLDVDECPD